MTTNISGFIDTLVKKLTTLSSSDRLYANIPKVLGVGHLALLFLSGISLVMGIFTCIRFGSLTFAGYGTAAALLLLSAQYVATKSFILLSDIIENHPSKISGPALTEIFAILQLIGALFGAFLILRGIAQGFLFTRIAYGLFMLIILYLASGLLAQADKHLNAQYDTTLTLAEQFLGLLNLFCKALAKLTPYIYATGVTVMTLMAIAPMVILLVRGQAAWTSAVQAGCLLSSAVVFALTPIILYILLMLVYLLTDVLKALLDYGKIGRLKT
ncbi:MAG: hypothetical protein LBV76_02610 [Deltaproteobacteria bacterium]|jgi:hypothetical protein|nr:hypothetical protein [Deltaproteobacteria bacterium]